MFEGLFVRVTFHVTMTAEARSLSQKETQELYLK